MDLTILVKVVVLWQSHIVSSQTYGTYYTAAVYEHNVILNPNPSVPCSRQAALEHMKKNLDVYEEKVATAAKKGAQIIVFPEDGIHGFNFTRQSIVGYLESIPDPQVVSWSPCLQPGRFPHTEVLHRLSCMAKNNALYLVANMPDSQDCGSSDPHCPPDGRYQFNTDVIFNDNGTLIAKYHKQNLYFESAFDSPPECEHVIFDTTFAGRFGIFTCFDILFYDPGITLLEKYKVKQVVYPAAWMNQLPLLSAIQIQQAFATAFELNFLGVNIHNSLLGMTGSGIYTPSHSVYHYDLDTSEGKLLVSKVPLPVYNKTSHKTSPPSSKTHPINNFFLNENRECDKSFVPKLMTGSVRAETFHSVMMYDNYTFIPVMGTDGDLTVCDGLLCCHLLYHRSHIPDELYALGVFNGLHVVHGTYYLEVCALVRCAGSTFDSCGGEIAEASTLMDFYIEGNFSTQYIFPSILASGMQLAFPDLVGWEQESYFMNKKSMSSGLVTAVLYGRVYEKD
nr:PREDICTED: biotinidase isoform X1 [Lepisosteus oculatus]